MCLLSKQHLYIFEELLIFFCIDHSINENVCFCLLAPPHPTLTKKKYKKKKKKHILPHKKFGFDSSNTYIYIGVYMYVTKCSFYMNTSI